MENTFWKNVLFILCIMCYFFILPYKPVSGETINIITLIWQKPIFIKISLQLQSILKIYCFGFLFQNLWLIIPNTYRFSKGESYQVCVIYKTISITVEAFHDNFTPIHTIHFPLGPVS